MPPVICKFWGTPQGCRFGDKCKFEHRPLNDNRGGYGNSNGNRFAALQNQDNSNARNNRYQQGGGPPGAPYSLEKEHIVTDLTADRPQWILSAYGPGRQAPAQLFGGPMREQSFEEMRLLHYMAAASGNSQQAVREAENLYHSSEQQIQTALNDVDGAIRFIVNAQNEHPNRVDNEQAAQGPWIPPLGSQPNPLSPSKAFQATTLNPLGATSQAAPPAFGAPSQPAPAFGQPSQPAGPAFGAPSTGGAFGQPAFGQSSQPGMGGTFGQPSQLGGAGGFGKASQLGGGGSLWGKPNPFAAPSSGTSNAAATPAPFSGFANATNAFSQAPAPVANGFGAPSQPITSAPFGAPSQPAQNNPFGQPPGGLNPLANTPAAPFGAPSPAKNPFATNLQPTNTNPFGASPAPPENIFGNNPPMANASNPFNTTQQNPPTSNPFGNPAVNTQNPNPAPPGPIQPAVNGTSGPSAHPPVSSYSTKDHNGRLTMFKGKRVTYQNGVPSVQNMDRSWSKIWFPEGPPPFYKDTEMDDSAYDASTKAVYMQMGQTGSFPSGVMPLLPPKREWCTWNF